MVVAINIVDLRNVRGVNVRIIGLDISAGYASAVLLDEKPSDLQAFYHSKGYGEAFFIVEPTLKNFDAIAELQPDLIVLEPTGTHYETIFCHHFEKRNLAYKRAPGIRVKSYRDDHGLDKSDEVDSLVLAAYGHDRHDDPRAWVPECGLPQLRSLILQRRGLQKIANRHLQRLRLQLQHEFPEASDGSIERGWGDPGNGWVHFINGSSSGRSTTYWKKKYEGGVEYAQQPAKRRSVPGTVGTGLSNYSQKLAEHLCDLWQQLADIEAECDAIASDPNVLPYVEAMERLGLNREVQITWLTRIFPFSKFLENGQPRRVRKLSRHGREVVNDLSLSQFKAALGIATKRNESGIRQSDRSRIRKRKGFRGRNSGDKKEKAEYMIGDPLCRTAFFMWTLSAIEKRHLKGEYRSVILAKAKEQKAKGKNLYQRSCNLQGYMARLLYRQLLKDERIR